MWVIHEISFLNTADNPRIFKPIVHLTDNNGGKNSIQLNMTAAEVRLLTIQQLEDFVNAAVNESRVYETPLL